MFCNVGISNTRPKIQCVSNSNKHKDFECNELVILTQELKYNELVILTQGI
jgi:hypothetical protein